MSELNYIIEMLELKDNNIKFYENCYHKEKFKGIFHKVFEGTLTYQPICCEKCGVLFDNKFEKHGFIEGNNNFIKVLKRIAFGFRSFRRFKARIMICKGLIKINRKKANAFALTS